MWYIYVYIDEYQTKYIQIWNQADLITLITNITMTS